MFQTILSSAIMILQIMIAIQIYNDPSLELENIKFHFISLNLFVGLIWLQITIFSNRIGRNKKDS
jgi:hypothetical protein